MKQAKILIADDEAAITTGLSAILEDAGYGVEVVADGQKAIDKLSVDRYGVVLADLKMPKLDGLTLLSELQHRQPIISHVEGHRGYLDAWLRQPELVDLARRGALHPADHKHRNDGDPT